MSKKKLKKLLIYIPVLWMISTSLKGSEEIFISPPRWIPKNIKWKNYKDAFEAIPYVKYILNTVKTTGLAVLGNVISAPMIGYAFGKLKWPGRDKVFLLVIATMMLPFSVTMIPLYSMSSKFGWINTYIPLVLPDFLGRSYFIFLMRQFYMNLPDELLEAARIDGAGEMWVYTRVALPLVKPAVVLDRFYGSADLFEQRSKMDYFSWTEPVYQYLWRGLGTADGSGCDCHYSYGDPVLLSAEILCGRQHQFRNQRLILELLRACPVFWDHRHGIPVRGRRYISTV